jgi:hypothetical protein
MWAQALAFAIGIWLMLAPELLGYRGAARINDLVVGPIAASFACVAMWEVGRGLRWVNLVLGAWLAASPLVLGAGLNQALSGLALCALSLVRGRLKRRCGGGWRSLFSRAAEGRGGPG